jgi:glycosyltransferase involved in cell wall biosynthesis
MILEKPLVSVIVATYNSSPFVIETLESAKAQTWQNIELIVSDDCSTDNTVELCCNWISANKENFIRTEVITAPQNTGISANCNRCIKASHAEWIKFVAGDDILLPNCIEDNMRFASENKEAGIIFSQVFIYQDRFTNDQYISVIPDPWPMNLMNPAYSAADQYKLLLLSDRITYTPSYFFKKQTLVDIGGYDERNKLVEDYPMWLKLTKASNRLFYFHKPTVGYRRHQQALNNMTDYGLFKPLVLKAAAVKEEFVFPFLPWDIAGSERHILRVSRFFQWAGVNKKTALFTGLYKFATIYTNPYRYVIFFKKKIMKAGKNSIFYIDS